MEPARKPDPNADTANIVPFRSESTEIGQMNVLERAESHRCAMQAYAFAILRRWPQAQEAVQDSLLVAYNRWEDCKDEEEIWPWLRRIVQLKCYAILRRWKRREKLSQNSLLELVEEDLNVADPQFSDPHSSDRVDALRRCFEKLRPKAQEILYDFYVLDREGNDIADDRGMKPNTVWSYLHRSRRELRRCITNRLGESAAAPLSSAGSNRKAENLLDRYFNETFVHPDSEKQLREMLEKNPGLLGQYVLFRSHFIEAVGKDEGHLAPGQHRQSKRGWGKPLALAATGLASLLGLNFILGEVSDRDRLDSDEVLLTGEEYLLPSSSPREFALDREGTRISLGGGGKLRVIQREILESGDPGKTKLALDSGALVAEVAPRGEGSSFQVALPDGEVEVIGTRFRVQAGALASRVGVGYGEVRFQPFVRRKPGKTRPPLFLETGESVFAVERGVMKFSSPQGSVAPWSPLVGFDQLEWEFDAKGVEETNRQVGMGSFQNRKAGVAGRFSGPHSILATTPVSLPDRFEISSRFRLYNDKRNLRIIASNSVIGMTSDGFRFGFDNADTTDRMLLRVNFGDGRTALKIGAPHSDFGFNRWHEVVVRIDRNEGTVAFAVDGQWSPPQAAGLPDFRMEGPLYLGGQEPSMGVSPLGGELDWLRIRPF